MRIRGSKISRRRIRWCAVFALASAATWTYGAEPPSEAAVKRAIFDEDVVKRIQNDDPGRPVRITFSRHAAIYLLDRNAAQFSAWLSRLESSEKTGVAVVFTYDVYGPRLTSVELRKP